jgi:transposase
MGLARRSHIAAEAKGTKHQLLSVITNNTLFNPRGQFFIAFRLECGKVARNILFPMNRLRLKRGGLIQRGHPCGRRRTAGVTTAASCAIRTVVMREVVNRLMYILSTGCQWRAIPKDLPPRTCRQGARSTIISTCGPTRSTLERIHHGLYVQCREQAGQEASPTAGIIDSHPSQAQDEA